MMGRPIRLALEDATCELHKEGGLFGIFGAQVSIVDSEGKYIYMRGPKLANNSPLYQYTLMPTRMRGFMGQEEMESWEQHDGFNFTKGQKVFCPLCTLTINLCQVILTLNVCTFLQLMKVVSADESAPDRDMVYGRSAKTSHD